MFKKSDFLLSNTKENIEESCKPVTKEKMYTMEVNGCRFEAFFKMSSFVFDRRKKLKKKSFKPHNAE